MAFGERPESLSGLVSFGNKKWRFSEYINIISVNKTGLHVWTNGNEL
jgi:hypothetical protein